MPSGALCPIFYFFIWCLIGPNPTWKKMLVPLLTLRICQCHVLGRLFLRSRLNLPEENELKWSLSSAALAQTPVCVETSEALIGSLGMGEWAGGSGWGALSSYLCFAYSWTLHMEQKHQNRSSLSDFQNAFIWNLAKSAFQSDGFQISNRNTSLIINLDPHGYTEFVTICLSLKELLRKSLTRKLLWRGGECLTFQKSTPFSFPEGTNGGVCKIHAGFYLFS